MHEVSWDWNWGFEIEIKPTAAKGSKKTPAFLHITNATESTFTDICKLPRAVKIGEHEYNQSMVVQYKSDMGSHFNAFINIDGQWLKYDGIDHSFKDEFISIARPRDFANDDWRADSVVYTINTN
jgi:hypothetical protein